MVLGENFKNNVNMNFVTPFPQGAQFLLLQDNKTKNLSARADMLSNPNGFDRNNTFNTQSCLQKTSNFSMSANQSLIEGFDGESECKITYEKKKDRNYAIPLTGGGGPDDRYNYDNLDDAKAQCSIMDNCKAVTKDGYGYNLRSTGQDGEKWNGVNSWKKFKSGNCDTASNDELPAIGSGTHTISNDELPAQGSGTDTAWGPLPAQGSGTDTAWGPLPAQGAGTHTAPWGPLPAQGSGTHTISNDELPGQPDTPTAPWPSNYPFQPLPNEVEVQSGANTAPPSGYQRISSAGDCRCQGTGYGLDSCGDTCCQYSPYTDEDPNAKYGVNNAIKNGKNWGRCFEKTPADMGPQKIDLKCHSVYGTNIPLYTSETCNSYNGQLNSIIEGQYGDCIDKSTGNSISWENRFMCPSSSSTDPAELNKNLINGPYKTVTDLHDRNHIGTPVQNAWSEGIEGFTNNSIFNRYKEPDNAIYKKNLQDKNSTIEMQEKLFNQANQYNRELKDMYNQADAFSKTNAGNNPYKGKNVSLSSGAKGYVTERGIFKWYPNSTVIDSTQGKNGCGTGLDYIDLGVDGSFKFPGSIIQSSPPMLVGTPMKPGQACGYAGSNVQITQGVNPSLINDNYRGCYKTNTDFSEQSDLGTTTKQACKSRALDLGKTLFALTNKKEDKGTCWVGSADYSNKPQDGVVDKVVQKEGNSILSGTNMFASKINNTNQIGGGLLRDGTLAIGLVPGGASTAGDVFGLTNEQGGMGHFIIDGAPPIAGCNKYIGGSVNIPEGSDSTLTWNNNDCLKMVAPNVNISP